jgi:hypothetical protein
MVMIHVGDLPYSIVQRSLEAVVFVVGYGI